MEEWQVIKKNGKKEKWMPQKIITAIGKSAERISTTLTKEEKDNIVQNVEDEIRKNGYITPIPIEKVHNYVECALTKIKPDVGESYKSYRNWVKKEAKIMQRVNGECNTIQFIGDKSNSNADSQMCSTKRVKKLDALETAQYEEYFLTVEEKEATEKGYIYIHDKGARQDTFNCCLFNIKKVLTGGFEMGDIWYNEPKSLDTAFDVIGDITLMAASQQYGGFTLPQMDKVLARYAEKTYNKYYKEILNIYMDSLKILDNISEEEQLKYKEVIIEKCDKLATDKTIRDMYQGFQGWEYKFNTVASSRGDYPFLTVSFGLGTGRWEQELSKAILNVRKGGQGKAGKKRPVLFPKLVFLYDEELHGKNKELEDVFETAIECSAKCMYPDYLSLTGLGYVPSMYKQYGAVVSPMGCRSFLSPWYERGGMFPADKDDIPIFEGRCNLGVVSLNLPMILAKSKRNGTSFYDELDYYLEMIRRIHLRTYDYLSNLKASINPLAFCEGGFYKGNLGLNDKIAPVLESATLSFGITALNELQYLYNGKSIAEDGQFAIAVMEYINNKINEFKNIDHKLYGIYGTPAESLCSKQVIQFRKEFGIITNVSDREYVSNSFHCHVAENITPAEKQDLEGRFWDLFNGGKIQYVRYPNAYNVNAIRTMVRRAMKYGYYEGVNLSLAYCNDCGHEELEMDVCPCCGSSNLTKIERMNGLKIDK